MSKVDLKVFEEAAELLGYENTKDFVYSCCEGDVNLGVGYEFTNDYPLYSLSRTDKVEYDRQYELYINERDTSYQSHVDNIREQLGYEHLDQEGGGEGGSEYCYGVFKLKGKVYRAEYSYYSYHGHEFDYILDTLKEVKPVQKTITVWE